MNRCKDKWSWGLFVQYRLFNSIPGLSHLNPRTVSVVNSAGSTHPRYGQVLPGVKLFLGRKKVDYGDENDFQDLFEIPCMSFPHTIILRVDPLY